jgi:hypothetical protein
MRNPSSNLKPGRTIASEYIAGDSPEMKKMIERAYRCAVRVFEDTGFI